MQDIIDFIDYIYNCCSPVLITGLLIETFAYRKYLEITRLCSI